MTAFDTSVVIAALVPWHTAHQPAREAVMQAGGERRLIAHVAFETTSSLSRMPTGRRVAARVVREALDAMFPADWLQLAPADARGALAGAVDGGVRGGALYDAIVGATAACAGVSLVTLDRRALPVYDLVGAQARTLAN